MADDKTPRSTTTQLNIATTAGDLMDERLVTQDDGVTKAKRAVVALGHADNDLVGEERGLPTADTEGKQLLAMILEEVRAMRMLMELVLDDTSTGPGSTADGELP